MLTVFEKVLMLQDIGLLLMAETENLAQLAALCKETRVDDGCVVFREDSPGSQLYFVVSGKVSLDRGGRRLLTVEKDALDYWSFFSEESHQVTATALESCTLLTIAYEDLMNLLTAEPELSIALVKRLCQMGRRLTELPPPSGG